MDCRSCPRGKGTLNDGLCFGGVVDAFSEGMVTDAIVLSGRNETRYSGPSVEMVAMVAEMKRGLGRLILREPTAGKGRAEGNDCDGCSAEPSVLFGRLVSGLEKGVGPYYEELRAAAARLEASAVDDDCKQCTMAAMDDLHFLAVQYEDLVRFVVREGFSIVL